MDRVGRIGIGITCCWGNSREKTKGNEITVEEKQDPSELAKDAAPRQQMIIPEGAPTVEEGPSADDPLSTLPKELMVFELMPFLRNESLNSFPKTSKALRKEADEFAGEQLPILKKELDELIKNSGIKGIKNPVGPFTNNIHELRVLTAFKNALPNAIRVLRDNGITDINATDNLGFTPLHGAAIHGHTEISRALIELGADVNADFGAKPLHWAAMNGHTEIARALIELGGADVNADNFGSTPLHEAARYGHTETVRALIELGADVKADNFGFTPLHEATRHGRTEIIEILRTAQSTQGCLPPSCSIM